MPSTRYASYSRGFTSRKSRTPKFFIPRTTCAMFTKSCGSWRTTVIMSDCRTVGRMYGNLIDRTTNSQTVRPSDASSNELENPEATRILPVAPQPHPPPATAPHQLAHAPHAAGEHFINDEVEAHTAARVGIYAGRPR